MSSSKHSPIPIGTHFPRLQREHAKPRSDSLERRLQTIILQASLELARFEARAGLEDADRKSVDRAFLDDMNRMVAEALSGAERACRERFVEKLLVNVDSK